MKRPIVVAALVIAGALGAAPARAQGDGVRLEYSASEGCPEASELSAEVQKRLVNGRLAGEGELARAFRIQIDVSPERALAHMDFVDADGREATRDVSAPSCEEAMRAIALIAALAIEARAEKVAHASPAPPPEPPRRADAMRRGRGAPPNPQKPVTHAAPVSRSEATFGVGTALAAESGFAPHPALRLALVGELGLGDPLLFASAAYADSGPTDAAGGTAKFRLYTLGLGGCPLALRPASFLALRPCFGVDAGILRAEGEKSGPIVTPKSATEPWLSAQALGRVELAPDPRIALGLEGGPGFPLIRQEFDWEQPDRVVHEVPAVTWRVAIGLYARLR
jgi:hypothetical protein